jgi:hypothetical protein
MDRERRHAADFDPELLRLFDRNVHGELDGAPSSSAPASTRSAA